jgi:[acyl-carrier-protein] S-malonyltransferase
MGRVGLVFPGQGAQYVGMGLELCSLYDDVRERFVQAGEVLGMDVAKLCFEGPCELLDLTINTQIAVLTFEMALYALLQKRLPVEPVVMAGHSLGEYAALHASGALGFSEVLTLVRARAHRHQDAVAVGEGAMAAVIGLDRAAVEEICRSVKSDQAWVGIAILNGPRQVTISGNTAAVEAAMARASEREGTRAVKLPISVPCHSPLLLKTAEWFSDDLQKVEFGECRVPVIPNCDPSVFFDRDNIRDLLARQIVSPVRWQETVEKMARMEVDTVVEIGPGRVLSGLIKRIHRKFRLLNVEDPLSLDKTLEALEAV